MRNDLVEQAKMYHEMGRPQTWIAKQLGVCTRTVKRYIDRPTEEEAEDARREERERYIEEAWRIMAKVNATVENGLDEGKISTKDAAIVGGIYFDKVKLLENRPSETTTTEKVTFVFESTPQSDPDGVSRITGPEPGDALRGGSGENIFPLPRSGEDGIGAEE